MILHNNHIRISRHLLKEKNQTHIANVDFKRPKNPSSPTLIHYVAAAKESILETAKRDDTEELTAIIKCVKIIRRAIEESDSWKFDGWIINQDKAIPDELLWVLKWIIQGDTAILTESRSREIHVTSENLSQMIIQAHKTNRQIKHKVPSCTSSFRSRIETPLTLGFLLHFYHVTRRKQVMDMLSSARAGVTYQLSVLVSLPQPCRRIWTPMLVCTYLRSLFMDNRSEPQ